MQNLIKNTPVLILCGGKGSRLSEETKKTPKPLIKIDKHPILFHIMKIYLKHGFKKFVLLTGYKHHLFEKYFFKELPNKIKQKPIISKKDKTILFKNFEVKILNTGLNTLTGARILKYKRFMQNKKYFAVTYGDGLANINIKSLIAHHIKMNKLATISAVTQPGRFGALKLNNQMVEDFLEKPEKTDNYINGGFFVLSPKVIDYIDGDSTIWERDPLERLAKNNELTAYHHNGFWQPMDTLRDKNYLEELWGNDKALWKIW